jgi:hypothetical protein
MYPATSTSFNDNLIKNTTQIRNQENPYHHNTQYDLMCSLKNQGIDVDLKTLGKVVNAIEVLPEYFPETKQPDCNNPQHMQTMSLLLAVQENNSTHLQKYSEIEVANAMNLLINHGKKDVENLKAGLRDSSMVNGLIASVPIAGAYFQDLFKKSMRPGVQASIGIEDIMNLGCRGKDGYISIENLLPVARCKLDKQGEKHLMESLANHMTKQDDEIHLIINGQEIHFLHIETMEEDISGMKTNLTECQKDIDSLKESSIQIEKAPEWKDNVRRGLQFVTEFSQHFTEHFAVLDAAEKNYKKNTKKFFQEAAHSQETLEKSNQDLLPFISTQGMVNSATQSKDVISKIETLLVNIEGFIKERESLSTQGDFQIEDLNVINRKIKHTYKNIQKHQLEAKKAFARISLGANVIASALAVGGVTQPLSAAVGLVGVQSNLIGSIVDRKYNKQAEGYTSLLEKYQRIGLNLGESLRENKSNIHSLYDQKDYARTVFISHLKRPETHKKYLNELEKSSKEKNDLLDTCESEISKDQNTLKHKTDALKAAEKYLTDKKLKSDTLKFFEKPEKEIKEAKKKVHEAEIKVSSAKQELLEIGIKLESRQEFKTNINSSIENLDEDYKKGQEIQHSQACTDNYRKKFDFLNRLLEEDPDNQVQNTLNNIEGLSLRTEKGKKLLNSVLSQTNKLVFALDKAFKTNLSGKVNTSSVAIMKAADFCGGIIDFNMACSSIEALIKDKKELEENKGKSTVDIVKGMGFISAIKLGVKPITSVLGATVALLEIIPLLRKNSGVSQNETQLLLQELENLQNYLSLGFKGFHQHIQHINIEVMDGFNNTSVHIDLVEDSIKSNIKELQSTVEDVVLKHEAVITFKTIRDKIYTSQSFDFADYRNYIEDSSFDLEGKSFKQLLANIKTESP